jgi:catechol 2,3-dioxygenase-like lactoylglutathione lyase family enzyme
MSQTIGARLSHVAICTSDLDRSLRFYVEALGFAVERTVEIGSPFDVLTELPGLTARGVFLKSGELKLELLGYGQPAAVGTAERRPMNQLGLTHLAVTVDDFEAAVRRIEQYGGQAHRQTKVETSFGQMMFCTDPNGVRLEVWQKPA